MTETTSKWLPSTALAAAKRKSDDPTRPPTAAINKLQKRIRTRFVQHMSVTLMKAQAKMIIHHAVLARRRLYLAAQPHRRRRARGSAASRRRAGGGSGPASRAGHGR